MDKDIAFVVILGIFIVSILWIVISIPCWIAATRGVSSQTISSIRLLSILGLFFGLTWLVALVWACLAPIETIEYKFEYEGSGMYEIKGIDKESGFDVTDNIAADSKQNAILKAQLRGILVSSAKYRPI